MKPVGGFSQEVGLPKARTHVDCHNCRIGISFFPHCQFVAGLPTPAKKMPLQLVFVPSSLQSVRLAGSFGVNCICSLMMSSGTHQLCCNLFELIGSSNECIEHFPTLGFWGNLIVILHQWWNEQVVAQSLSHSIQHLVLAKFFSRNVDLIFGICNPAGSLWQSPLPPMSLPPHPNPCSTLQSTNLSGESHLRRLGRFSADHCFFLLHSSMLKS